jgi:hypothetical protein
MRRFLLTLLIIFGAGVSFVRAAGAIEITAGVDKETAGIGDRITYSIKVTAEKDTEVEFPAPGEKMGGLDIRDLDLSRKGSFGRKILTQSYILGVFEPGEYTIPAMTVRYQSGGKWFESETEEVQIAIESALEAEKGVVDIRDIKGPIAVRGVLYYSKRVILIAIVIGIIAAAILFIKRRREDAATPKKPAHIIAYEALDDLNKKSLIGQGKIKEYYVRLSDIVRRYLEDRFELRAPEMTTEEFLEKAKETPELSREHKSLLKDFMSHCDLVKFAKYGPTDAEIGSTSGSAKGLIDQTKHEETEGGGNR